MDHLKVFLEGRGITFSDRLKERINKDKENLFRISEENFKTILNNYLAQLLHINEANITQRNIDTHVLDCFKTQVQENPSLLLKEKQTVMQIEDSEDENFQQDLDYFEAVKVLNVKKLIPGQQTYTKNELIDLIKSYPQDYPQLGLSMHKSSEKQANFDRFERFKLKYKSYLDKVKNFQDKVDDLTNQTITIVCRAIFGRPSLENQPKYFLEYQTLDGFDYVEPELNTLSDYFIYPSQMLLLTGSFFMKKFQIENIINNDTFSNEYLKPIQQPPLQKQCKVMFIKGPFHQKNFAIEDLLKNLKKLIEETFHHLVVIQGPVISYKRKSKKEEYTYQTIRQEFLTGLQTNLDKQQVLYMEDENEIFLLRNTPIPAMEQNKFDHTRQKVITLPSPCVLQIGNINIAIHANKLYDDLMTQSLFKTSVNQSKQKALLRSIQESQNLHPIFTSTDQIQYTLINNMSYDFPIDMFILSSEKEEGFIEKINNKIFLCLKSFLRKKEFGQYGHVVMSDKGIHAVRIFESNCE